MSLSIVYMLVTSSVLVTASIFGTYSTICIVPEKGCHVPISLTDSLLSMICPFMTM